MHVVSPARYQPKPVPRKRTPYLRIFLILVLLAGLINYIRPLPQPVATLSLSMPTGFTQPKLSWPSGGQAAAAASGYGLLGTDGDQKQLATASTAKVITALCVLQKAPLQLGHSGPTYTISAHDMDILQNYVDQDGSVMAVQQGETLTEYQALEALMIPSANNIADSLVNWVFGGQASYADYASGFLQQHGLNQTHIGSDASGFDPSTTSTSSDLTQLGLLALQSPVLMQIAGQSSADFPVVGRLANYDTVLGENGITGLKTGNNDADMGAFILTARHRIGSQDVLVAGAVMGMPDLDTALQAASALSASLQQSFEQITLAQKADVVGKETTAWGASSPIDASSPIQLVRWKGSPLVETHHLQPTTTAGKIGTIKVSAGRAASTTDLKLAHSVSGPSFWWRLTRH